jgi:hypothetical protein
VPHGLPDPQNSVLLSGNALKQASVAERRKVYDAFVSAQAKDRSVVTARVEAPLNVSLARMANGRFELVACSLFFAFPLSV